ncbi:MAG TPA: hypothetical protein DEA78_26000 [Cyanobacteria bacterium UBA11159]|nr:hypothetical protein [Cyanobacteria bacterium UBA11367]HBE58327.1 hypothetical protein [Cyanobacteria bacterium UBA11366]HBK64593.1 hypothetical protein [Cyanobacteria bacterium UBA11166]HBR77034.1 hypothetical protein [Cyanobacteria bacterium UBA11159]HBS70156.1 hypothetical protein [Cyanobacteria bacterium UBA11153]HCA96120.1 hypothetical protein [Cyanobacteria bacterium UBA9226]
MSTNLITAEIVNPTEFPLERIRIQVAAFLKIPFRQIERVECWHHQIWVKFVEGRGKFISYRHLPIWVEQGIIAINNCRDRASLDELGEILRTEREWYDGHQESEALEKWREAWVKKSALLREEEERMKPIRDRIEAARKWQEAWGYVLGCCSESISLEELASEIKRQAATFADLPEAVAAVEAMWQQRWQELNQASA